MSVVLSGAATGPRRSKLAIPEAATGSHRSKLASIMFSLAASFMAFSPSLSAAFLCFCDIFTLDPGELASLLGVAMLDIISARRELNEAIEDEEDWPPSLSWRSGPSGTLRSPSACRTSLHALCQALPISHKSRIGHHRLPSPSGDVCSCGRARHQCDGRRAWSPPAPRAIKAGDPWNPEGYFAVGS